MDLLPLILCTALALLLGGVLGWLLGGRGGPDVTRLREENARLAAELAGAAEARDLHARRAEALDQRARQDQEVLRALAPVQNQLATVEEQVRLMERERADQYGSLRESLDLTRRGQDELRDTTHSLSSALRSTSARGSWGEAQLRRVVEAAGMAEHVSFQEQATGRVRQADGTVKTVRPDMVVALPGGKELVLDSKVPLDSYLEAQDAQEESEKALWESRHAKALKAHVDQLAQKKYWDSREVAPEVVLCFLPMESALSAALRADPGLLDHASARGVALVSPVSLLAALKAVSLSWRQDSVSRNARELLTLSKQLYERLATVGGHLQSMGRALTRSVESYNQMLGSLESRVLVTARRIADLDSAVVPDDRLEVDAVDAAPKPLTAPELQEDARRGTGD